ncbi:hypothetical protein KKH39_03155 [Patescibacteria group bacterium]|nr:hypothetical protein [Patescibacteria group bacterium]
MKLFATILLLLVAISTVGCSKSDITKPEKVTIKLKDNPYSEVPEPPKTELKDLRHVVFHFKPQGDKPNFVEDIVTASSVNELIRQKATLYLNGGVDPDTGEQLRELVRIRVGVPTIVQDISNPKIERLDWAYTKYWNKEGH